MPRVFGVFFYGEADDFIRAVLAVLEQMKNGDPVEIKKNDNAVMTEITVSDDSLSEKPPKRLSAYGGKNRKKIMDFIREKGSIGFSDLKDVGVAQSSLSYHLNLLIQSGDIQRIGDKRPYRYEIPQSLPA